MLTWRCVKNCGACCYLEPSERPDLEDLLPPEDVQLYLSLVGDDGWCIHFDRTLRECTIYAERPRFCRVQADVFGDMFGIEPEELDEFAVDCCRQHIGEMYGDDSLEMLRFDRAVNNQSSVISHQSSVNPHEQ